MSDYMQGDPDRNPTAIPFSDDEKETTDKPEDLFAEPSPEASPEERLTRKRKQEERMRRMLDEGKQSKEEAKALRAEQETLKREIAELRAIASRPAPMPQPTGKDPYEARLDALYERQGEAYQAAQAEIKAGTWTADRAKHYEKVARDIETEKARILISQGIEQQRNTQRAESAQQIWVNKYPEVYSNPRAYQFAEATWKRKLSLLDPGQQPSADMIDEVMTEAMAQFKLGKKAAPTASEKSRLSGVPASGSGGGPARGDGIQMTPELKRMATALYSDLPEGEAIKKWVNGPGKRLREKKLL